MQPNCFQSRYFRYVSGSTIYLILCIAPFALIYYFGYYETLTWNLHSKKTIGMIADNYVVQSTCQRNCGDDDHQCSYQCYVGIYIVNYTIGERNQTYTVKITHNEYFGDYVYATEQMDSRYPIGSYVNVFYNPANPSDAEMELVDAKIPFIFAFVILSIGSFLLMIWIICEVYLEYRARKQQSTIQKCIVKF